MNQICNLCFALGVTLSLSKEEKISHADEHRKQLKFIGASSNVDIFDQCFPELQASSDKDKDNLNVQSTLDQIVSPFDYCIELLQTYRRNNRFVKCAICDRHLVVADTKLRRRNNKALIIHATSHVTSRILPKSSLIVDLIESHPKRDATFGRKLSVIAIYQCFGHVLGREFSGTFQSEVKRSWSLPSYCKELLKETWRNNVRRIPCNQCGSIVEISKSATFHRSADICTYKLIYHAQTHLGKLLFSCNHCSNKFSTREAMSTHLFGKHHLNSHRDNYTDISRDFYDEIIEMIFRCFNQSASKVHFTEIQRKEMNSDRQIKFLAGSNVFQAEKHLLCHQFLRKFGDNQTLKCRVCSHVIKVGRLTQCQKVIEHATTHVGKPLYKCRRCHASILVMSSVYRHMKSKHGITKQVKKEYDDCSNDYHADILAVLTKCFDWSIPK